MPTPETHAQTIVDLLVTLGGGAAGGAAISEITRWVLGRKKNDAEALKLSAEALSMLDSAVQKRAAEIMASDKAKIERLEARIEAAEREHKQELQGVWAYCTVLRNKLIEHHIEVPLPNNAEVCRSCEPH